VLLALTTTLALASPWTAESETVIGLRGDYSGEPMIPAYQFVRLYGEPGEYAVSGYAGLEWGAGPSVATDPDLYLLNVSANLDKLQWTLGRLQVANLWGLSTLDGGQLSYRLRDDLTVSGWAGWMRNQDLDDFLQGVGSGRVQATWSVGDLMLRAGVQAEGNPDTAGVLRQDLEARWRLADHANLPTVRAVVAIAEPDLTLEQARLEGSLHVRPNVVIEAFAQHRKAAVPDALLADRILETFAPEGTQDLGLGARLIGARWAVLSGRYRLSTFQETDQRRWAHAVDVEYKPGRTSSNIDILPLYRFRHGPGGQYHALLAAAAVDLGESAGLSLRAGVVPYQKLDDPWDIALDAGATVRYVVGSRVHLSGAVDVGHSALFDFELRASAVLDVVVP